MSPFLFLSILLMFTSYNLKPATSIQHHNNITDLESLLAFKAHVSDPDGILSANWTTNTSFCNWFGVSCSRRHKQRVTAISLFNMSLKGTISPYLANLSFLSYIDLKNNSLIGPIPPALGHLPRLAHLVLQYNFLSGPIPSTILNMSSLIYFIVVDNNLSGSLLPSNNTFTRFLPHIQTISLGSNYFTGEVLSSFAQCQDLQTLALVGNQFSGNIPADIGRWPKLTILYLGVNQLTGTIPTSLGNLTTLNGVGLETNNLTGVIPQELGNLPNLRLLSLSDNNLHSSIPTSLLNDSMIFFLDLAQNKLTGSVPINIGMSLPLLTRFLVGGNRLTGDLEFISSLCNCRNLQLIDITTNNLEGVLPDSIGNLSKTLQKFYAYENHINGKLPVVLGNLTGLILLYFHGNDLTGTIPSTLTRLEALQAIDLASNKISGTIPYELGLVTSLSAISLSYNLICGPIPDSLANLSMLQYLNLSNNNLSSSIPQSLWTFGSLLQLDLSRNTLYGTLPPHFANVKSLIYLDLSMNRLSGNITSAFVELQMLQYLDLSSNSLHGQIPISFARLVSVTYLNLSHNFLSGNIPEFLANLSYLESLDLSYNKLVGQIPKGGVFLNVTIPLLMGNEALCGAPQLHFAPCPTNIIPYKSRRKLQSLKYILPAIAASFILLACLCLIYAFYRRRKAKTRTNTSVKQLGEHRLISRYELAHATNNFSEANLLGRGGFGSVFRGCIDDGLTIAVKVFNLEVEGALKSFDAECQVLRTVRHRNLIKIINVCSSLDFKAVVLQFMPNGNLEQWLYSDNYYLNLLQRLNIMVDVSLALEYLHHHHPNVVLHCDLKPTNVLLDEEMVAHVSDFGIAKLLLGNRQSIASTSMPGTIGYIAPEYIWTGRVSKMGDVYSFGILLLETFTRKRPSDNMYGEESSLREWVCKDYPTAILDIVDYNLVKDHSSSERPSRVLTTMQHCLLDIVELGLLCSRYSPKERISMMDVVSRLQKIKMGYLSNI